jgi:4-hydroxy-tetrahydrodipicolinate synthase
MAKKDRLKGIVLSLPTPTKGHYELDLPTLKEHVSWLIDQGMAEGKAVLMANSGLGAGYFLTREEYDAAMKTLVDAANGKVPTMVGVFDSCTKEAVRKAKIASDVGVDFLQVNPPHYMAPVDDETYLHYSMINDATNCGIMVYNTPWCAMNYEIKPKLMRRLIGLDNVAGAKWASNDAYNYITMLKEFSNDINFIENGYLITTAFKLGAKGYISLLGNIAPKAEIYLYGMLEKGEYDKFDSEFRRLHAWRDVLGSAEDFSYEGVGEGAISAAIMEAVGKPVGDPMPPQRKIGKESIQKVREILEQNRVLETLATVG